ncbi:primosomal protein N' [Sutterella sp.]|uniref:replication restart helicase PriA n=1 Tax=Sutterella sp. TaxID=1981025 RepID=UPI0026E0CE70|nr:primosomal protein N' [Sutterella sp.]MDO5530454.1 primosomal protein N' [Sutterella sp.]
MARTDQFAKVLIDAPGLAPLDYRVPEEMLVAVGDLVLVTLGARRAVGLVVLLSSASDIEEKRLKRIQSVLKFSTPVSSEWLSLTRFAATYYLRAWGESALPAIPAALRRTPTPRQEKRIEGIRAVMPAADPDAAPAAPAPALNAEQEAAAAAVLGAEGFRAWLLFGVTGSGKTEVYLRLIEETLARDPEAQALLLVPEINLTPQLVGRVRARFPREAVAALNSEFTDRERAASWLSAHEGQARILVGTRMAIFASFRRLRLILVDEEHDLSYKAGDGLRYSARDLAVWRASKLACPVVLGSATPSLESWAKAKSGGYGLLRLSRRAVEKAELPEVELTPPPEKGASGQITEYSRRAIEACLESGRQALVFLNRRGYSPVLSCPACDWVSTCARCSAFTVYHKREKALICHHCGWRRPVPEACPGCGNVDILPRGTGTERIEEELEVLFPGKRVLRIDRDTASAKNAAEEAFRKVHRGEVDILVGTQMVAKGHDFQKIGLVLVLNPDAQILSPSTRARERLFATLMQVAGRAGRAGTRGRVLIQTRFPEDTLFTALAEQDYVKFAEDTLDERRESGCVPYVHQALLTAEADMLSTALAFLEDAAKSAMALGRDDVLVYDPVPMPLVRLMNRERGQLLVESVNRMSLHRFLVDWERNLRGLGHAGGLSWVIEVDPLET